MNPDPNPNPDPNYPNNLLETITLLGYNVRIGWRETLLVYSERQQAKSLPVPSCVPSRCAGVGVVSGSSGLGWVNINGSSTARSLHK